MRISDWSSDVCSSDLARQYAAAHQGKTWLYEFDWRSPACDGELGACHGIEMPFVFKTLPTVSGPRGLAGMDPPPALAAHVHALWAGFARRGSYPWTECEARESVREGKRVAVRVKLGG